MGKEFVALIDVIPEDTDEDFDALIEKFRDVLPKVCTIESYDVIPIAFGLKKARIRVRYPEEWGGTDKIEEYFNKVEGLQGVEGIAFSKA